MKSIALLTGILALAAPLAVAQAATTTWISDPAHSEVDFAIQHLTISTVHGRLGDVHATIRLNAADITKSTVTATIGTGTVDTGVAARDADLRSANFFDVAKDPEATFTSTSVASSAGGLTVHGNLTLHGATRPVVLAVQGPNGPIVSVLDHKVHAGYSATTTISRSAFGLGAKYPAALVGDEVKLTIDLDVVKQ
ncbi:MAG: YceI family protein [Terracidiphilus sp.]